MFTKTILLRRKRRLRVIRTILVIGALLVFSPMLLSILLMTIEEITTGKTMGENNSIMGFFFLLSIGAGGNLCGPCADLVHVDAVGPAL